MATALLFPGQGSQTADMRETVERSRPELVEAALERVGADPFERAGESTRFAQPAIYCASLAGWSRLGEPEADFLAGHSMGEFGALAAAGSLSAEDGLSLVTLRGRLMEEAAERNGGGGMLAVMGPGVDEAGPIAEELGLTVANYNSPDQVVMSGADEALEQASQRVTAAGLRVRRLAVSGAFHSPAMEDAAAEFESVLRKVQFRRPRLPVFSSVTAREFDHVRKRLAEGITRSVRWRQTLGTLYELGVRRYVEVGPGKVLTGLVKRTLDGVEAKTASSLLGAADG
jgi:[acyl-carrier-protein] S-malonyltransferase